MKMFSQTRTAARAFLCSAPFGALVLSASALLGQAGTISLQGTITDLRGGGIAKASVTVRSEVSGGVVTSTTDEAGRFSVNGLVAGPYTVEAFATGFSLTTRKGVQVADHKEAITVALGVGSASDEIESM